MPKFRHRKRGTEYTVVTHTAQFQCATHPDIEAIFDNRHFTVYVSVKDGAVWIRPTTEFLDGRFEKVNE